VSPRDARPLSGLDHRPPRGQLHQRGASSTPWRGRLLGALALIALTLAVGRALRRVALDDPYVTYRYAENLLSGLGPVYNPGERVLSTTAFGYALLLAAVHAVTPWFGLPSTSNAISAAGLGALGVALYTLAARHGRAAAGLGAGVLVLLSPLLLSSLGLETCLFLGTVGWSAVAFDARRPLVAAVLAAGATALRADGALAFGVLWLCASAGQGEPLLRSALTYTALVVPYEALLAAVYGSPIPTTLRAKVAQATIAGWSDYLGGLRDLVADRLALSRLYWTAAPLGLAGLAAALIRWWALPLVLWGVLQAAVYQLLGVASYTWYYAPLVPGTALLVALGAEEVARLAARRVHATPLAASLLALVLLAPLGYAQVRAVRQLYTSVPEPRALAYQRAGEWLAANTAPSDRVAVMEVGIMGYYAARPMVDLLGLIRPETIDALRREDFFWTIAESQADWVVLTGKNPLWFQFAQPDHWFHQYYAPAERIEQPGFWGTPLTIYRRQAPPRQSPPALDAAGPGRFGEALSLDRVVVERTQLRPGDYLTIQLTWRALTPPGRDHAAFVHVVTAEPKVVAQHDTPVMTSRWPVGQPQPYYHPIRLPADLPAGRYRVEVGLYKPEAPLERLVPRDAPHERNVAVVAELTVEP
jgi:hypothetical protein